MQMEHEKCLEIIFQSNAQIEPTQLVLHMDPGPRPWFGSGSGYGSRHGTVREGKDAATKKVE